MWIVLLVLLWYMIGLCTVIYEHTELSDLRVMDLPHIIGLAFLGPICTISFLYYTYGFKYKLKVLMKRRESKKI